MNQTLVGYVALAGSVALHGFAVTRSAEPARSRRPPSIVELTVARPAAPPSPPAPEPEPKPEPPQPRPLAKSAAVRPSAPSPEAPGSPPRETTGVTLTGDITTSFEAPAGSDHGRSGVFVAGTSPPAASSVPPRPAAARPATAPPAVPIAELSRKPVPPSLGSALRRNYPPAARSLGKSGDAKVRARIETTGEIRVATVTAETSGGFGEACRRALLGSRWSPPLDKSGRAVATFITYQCKFRVDD